LEALAVKDVDIFNGHLVYFTAIWYILWPFDKFYAYLVYFVQCWYLVPRKNLATLNRSKMLPLKAAHLRGAILAG
jgi:hypothetical protein